MDHDKSYRRIVSTTSAIAGASVVNIVTGLIRTKIAAVVLGPAGLGLAGLFQSLIATASAISGLGLSTVGTRQIAQSLDTDNQLIARRALAWGTFGLAALGMMLFWLFRHDIAEKVVGNGAYSSDIGLLAIGVALTVVSGSQTALLNGMRRIGDVAFLSITSGFLSTLLGVGVLYAWGSEGIVAFVLVTPLANSLVGWLLVSRLPRITRELVVFPEILGQWTVMIRLGTAIVTASAAFGLAQLALRAMVVHEIGSEALGQFQAAWTISVIYAGFVFQAMGADYYPRLAASVGDDTVFNRLVNEQAEVVVLLSGPVLIGVLALAPWIVTLAYTAKFTDAAIVLRWQVLGDLIKVASWPLGFVNLVTGDSRMYLFSEVLMSATLVGVAWIGMPLFGIEATGIAVLGMNAVYFAAVMIRAKRRTGFKWQIQTRSHFLMLLTIAIAVFLVARQWVWAGASLGMTASLLLGIYAAARMAHMTGLGGALGRTASLCRRVMMKLGVRME